MPDKKETPYRLPRNVKPIHYHLEIQPDLSKFVFSGKERVTVDIKESTSVITMHCVNLKIHKAYLIQNDRIEKVGRISTNKKKETITLFLNREIQGRAELYLEFEGTINEKMHGFYRTSYTINGTKRYGAATQFEATDARRAFPCWDEPDRKARFSLTLIVPKNLTALSNMPIVREEYVGDSLKRVIYDTTPPMSTYLLAFVVAELESIEAIDRNGIPIRVWTTIGKKEQGRFALECALHTLPYFADWFGIGYSFPKLDMVAIPDFAAGAMENWGLITYRETALLVDPQNSATSAKQRVAEVVDHELAHQWFGNLVTMAWWDDLWLNEGFASYMGPKAVDHQFPEWDIWTQFVADDFIGALFKDSLKNTHPVEVPVKEPHEINEIFDAITYRKGSVVNRMIEHYLGEEDFRRGLNSYLNRYAYGNAKTKDLWQVLEEVSGKPVRDIMESYTKQPGYPLLTVKVKESSKGKLMLELEQRRFLIDGSKDKKNLLWKIPVGILTSSMSEPIFEYMKERKMKLSVKLENNEWIKLNPYQSGFYRVLYPQELLKRLIEAIRNGSLSTIDRLGFLDDVFALSLAGFMKTSQALGVLTAYQNETNFSVWTVISKNIKFIDNLIAEEPWKDTFDSFVRDLFRPIGLIKGWEKSNQDTHLDIMLRSLVLRNLGVYGDIPTIEEAKRRFWNFINGKNLDPDLRLSVYTIVARHGGKEELDRLIELYEATDLHEEKNRILTAIGQFYDKNLLRRALEFALSTQVRLQDTPFTFNSVGQNPRGKELAWEFLKENWKTLMERYGNGGLFLLARIIEGTTTNLCTRDKLEDVESFFKTHKVPGAKRTIKQAIEMIKVNIAVIDRDRKDIKEWLESYSQSKGK